MNHTDLSKRISKYRKMEKKTGQNLPEIKSELQTFESNFSAHEAASHVKLTSPPAIYFAGNFFFNIEQVLFFDVECVELGFGYNNTPWLIGMAWFSENGLKIKQIFSPTPLQEPEALDFLDETWKNFSCVISYNGKSFDIPLIKSRFLLFEKSNPHIHTTHIDLYHVFGKLIDAPRYRLIDMEKNRLEFERKDDLSGAYSGQAYFEWLKHGDRALLDRIIEHNRLDLESMAALSLDLDKTIQGEKNSVEILQTHRLYRLEIQPDESFTIKNISFLKDKNSFDCFTMAVIMQKNKNYIKAYMWFRRAHRKGRRIGLLRAISILSFRLKQHQKAIRLAEKYLPLEEYKIQKKILDRISRMKIILDKDIRK